MSIRLRDATPADAAVLHGLIVGLATYEREPDAVLATPETLGRDLAAHHPPFECVLAEDDGDAVGFALYFQSYSTWRGRAGLYLEDLFVVPTRRGEGIGRALLARVAARAVARGCARLEWAVLDWNTPAIRFYERLGARALTDWTTHRLTDGALEGLARLDAP